MCLFYIEHFEWCSNYFCIIKFIISYIIVIFEKVVREYRYRILHPSLSVGKILLWKTIVESEI